MNKFEKLFFIFLLPFFFLAGSCSDDAPSLPDSRAEALMMLTGLESKSWMLSRMKLNGANVTLFLKSCDKDNVYTFFRNGEGQVTGNEKKCSPDEPDTLETGYWELSEDIKTLTLVLGSSAEEFELTELSDDVFQMKKDVPDTLAYFTYKRVN